MCGLYLENFYTGMASCTLKGRLSVMLLVDYRLGYGSASEQNAQSGHK